MKRKHFSTDTAKVTWWVDDFDIHRWDIAITRKILTEMSKEDFKKLLDAFHDISEVLDLAAAREAGRSF